MGHRSAGLRREPEGHLAKRTLRLAKRLRRNTENRVPLVLLHELRQLHHILHEERAALETHLAAEKVERLDAVGALVDGGDLHIPQVLLHRVVAAVAVTAEDLDAELRCPERLVGRVGLHDGNHEVEHVVVVLLLALRVGAHAEVGGPSRARDERPGALCISLHQHEVSPNVGVPDDLHARATKVGHVAALLAVLGVGNRLLEGGVRDRARLHRTHDARLVHQLEHVDDAAAGLADHVAIGGRPVAERQLAGRRAVDAHLVLDALDVGVVEIARGAIVVHPVAGHGKERDALDAGRVALHAGKHQVNNIAVEIGIAARDVDLRALDAVAPIRLQLRGRHEVTHRRTGSGLGEAHRAAPGARIHLLAVELLELLAAEVLHQVGGTRGQLRVHEEGLTGPVHRLKDRHHRKERKALSAELRRVDGAVPAVRPKLLPGLCVALRRRHPAIRHATTLGVAGAVDGSHHIDRKLDALVRHGVQRLDVEVCILLEAEKLLEVVLLVKDELPVARVELQVTHDYLADGDGSRTGGDTGAPQPLTE